MMRTLHSAHGSRRRPALIAALAALLFFLGSNVALACLCDLSSPTDAALRAATVFTGVARGRVTPERLGFGERVEFNVETVYKGAVPSRYAVTVEATDCGYVFVDGERYTVFVTAEGNTNLCMGNVRGVIDPAMYGVRATTTYPRQSLDLDQTGRVALAAMVVVALGGFAAIRMRRSRSA